MDVTDSLGHLSALSSCCLQAPPLRDGEVAGGLFAGKTPGLSGGAKASWLGQACQDHAWWQCFSVPQWSSDLQTSLSGALEFRHFSHFSRLQKDAASAVRTWGSSCLLPTTWPVGMCQSTLRLPLQHPTVTTAISCSTHSHRVSLPQPCSGCGHMMCMREPWAGAKRGAPCPLPHHAGLTSPPAWGGYGICHCVAGNLED